MDSYTDTELVLWEIGVEICMGGPGEDSFRVGTGLVEGALKRGGLEWEGFIVVNGLPCGYENALGWEDPGVVDSSSGLEWRLRGEGEGDMELSVMASS